METESSSPIPPPASPLHQRAVTIFGVGTAGVTLIEQMAKDDFRGAKFLAVNTDGSVTATLAEIIHLEGKLLRGLGTGGDPERGRELAEEQFDRLQAACAGAEVVILLAGLGGGTGSGVSR